MLDTKPIVLQGNIATVGAPFILYERSWLVAIRWMVGVGPKPVFQCNELHFMHVFRKLPICGLLVLFDFATPFIGTPFEVDDELTMCHEHLLRFGYWKPISCRIRWFETAGFSCDENPFTHGGLDANMRFGVFGGL
ncbi:hypothetical protein J1614_007911 [Plenodomus biglobosus]|nr:hypothetical protein J1614_007911 [Plenodomus biglobosus]